jgi:hypothetical protein
LRKLPPNNVRWELHRIIDAYKSTAAAEWAEDCLRIEEQHEEEPVPEKGLPESARKAVRPEATWHEMKSELSAELRNLLDRARPGGSLRPQQLASALEQFVQRHHGTKAAEWATWEQTAIQDLCDIRDRSRRNELSAIHARRELHRISDTYDSTVAAEWAKKFLG